MSIAKDHMHRWVLLACHTHVHYLLGPHSLHGTHDVYESDICTMQIVGTMQMMHMN